MAADLSDSELEKIWLERKQAKKLLRDKDARQHLLEKIKTKSASLSRMRDLLKRLDDKRPMILKRIKAAEKWLETSRKKLGGDADGQMPKS